MQDLLPGRKESVGRAADNRVFINGVLWVLRSGARWSDLPERYGKYKSDCTQALTLLGERKADAVLADKGDDADAVVQHIKASGAQPVIPPKANRKVQRPCNKLLYKQRNRIERCFSQLKHFRRLATRFEKNKVNFEAVVGYCQLKGQTL